MIKSKATFANCVALRRTRVRDRRHPVGRTPSCLQLHRGWMDGYAFVDSSSICARPLVQMVADLSSDASPPPWKRVYPPALQSEHMARSRCVASTASAARPRVPDSGFSELWGPSAPHHEQVPRRHMFFQEQKGDNSLPSKTCLRGRTCRSIPSKGAYK